MEESSLCRTFDCCVISFQDLNLKISQGVLPCTVSSKSIRTVTHFLKFSLYYNHYEVKVQTVSFHLREITALFVHCPPILWVQKNWDKFTNLFVKVVKNVVFDPVFLARWRHCCLFWLCLKLCMVNNVWTVTNDEWESYRCIVLILTYHYSPFIQDYP